MFSFQHWSLYRFLRSSWLIRWLSGLSGSTLFLFFSLFILLFWILSSEFIIGGSGSKSKGGAHKKEHTDQEMPFSVRVRDYRAQDYAKNLMASGHTESPAQLTVKFETAGRVVSLPSKKGRFVEQGDVLCQLDVGVRKFSVAKAKARFIQAEMDFKAATKLQNKGLEADSRVRTLKAQRDAAAADVAESELELKRTNVFAPFSGMLHGYETEIGDVVNRGNPCATLGSYDPITVVAFISEQEVSLVKMGFPVHVKLTSGQNLSGKLDFVSRSAEPETRTFRVEVSLPNPGYEIYDGITAQLFIQLPSTRAHKLRSDILFLDEEGHIGVYIVDNQYKVRFFRVEILENPSDGNPWVSGLPEEARVITAGQHYVNPGQLVRPVQEKELEHD